MRTLTRFPAVLHLAQQLQPVKAGEAFATLHQPQLEHRPERKTKATHNAN
jgi:hypothetical protein